ncbi:CoA ester lyase [Ramlibacter sp. WS9]|uniref:HpcH/HpaI aldolase/citrate lyase family protein n=1 Tax=Ramlibacter sp. WS9 TaxID=1882741 RepID=UPI0011418F1C|nr:CoA ester lyase [Ramlibacter sp. WS9]ROZ68793.1 CoA ester lyase [Ramlibacter sp. WS9]
MSRIARSFLFVPGDRPERFSKAAASGAHDVIMDLEDAVAPAAKAQARSAVAAWLGDGGRAVVRINGADTPWFEEDVVMLHAAPGARVMLPKAEPHSLARLAQLLPQHAVIALVETVAGYLALREVAAARGVERLAFGSVDFAAESGIADEGEAMTGIRIQFVLESCRAQLAPPVDGVGVEFHDEGTMQADALRSRQLGFGGKLCIHPRQVPAVNGAFRPSEAEVGWAQRVLAAFELSRGAATSVDGKMIDKPVVERALRITAESAVDGE